MGLEVSDWWFELSFRLLGFRFAGSLIVGFQIVEFCVGLS